MIYLLSEQIMNGTVCLDYIHTGVEADSFGAAFEKVTKFENWSLAKLLASDENHFAYTMPIRNGLQVYGSMMNKPLVIR